MARLPERILEIARSNNRELRRLDKETRKALQRRMEAVKESLQDELMQVSPETFRAQQVRMSLLFADQASRGVVDNVEDVLTVAAGDAAKMAGYDVTREIDAWWDHYGHEATAPNFGAITSLDDEILIERFENSLDDYGQAVANSIRTDVIQTVGTRGDRGALTTNIQETIDRERWRAERIARTEVQHAYNASHHGTLTYARDSGLMDDMGKTCIVTYDIRTDDDSLPLDGQVKALDEMFVDGDGREYLHPPGRPNDREKEVAHPLEDAEPGDENPDAAEERLSERDEVEAVEKNVQEKLIEGRRNELRAEPPEIAQPSNGDSKSVSRMAARDSDPTPWDKEHPSPSREDIVELLSKDGTTPLSEALADRLDRGELDIEIAADDVIDDFLTNVLGDTADEAAGTAAFHDDGMIVIRESLGAKAPIIVHEGSHFMDDTVASDIFTGTARQEEIRAVKAEEAFRAAKGWPPLFQSEQELLQFIDSYPPPVGREGIVDES